MCRRLTFVGFFTVAVLTTSVRTQEGRGDWVQWRGPNRDGSVPLFTPPRVWPEALTLKWKVDVGAGYANPLVVGSRLYTFTRREEDEVVTALEADTGRVVWETRSPASFTVNSGAARHGPGPKSTPVFAHGKLFTLGMTGRVTALDASTGARMWQTPADPRELLWGTRAFSPLVEDGLVIVHLGGHDHGVLTALDANTGKVKWAWDGDGPAYASPIVVTLDGTRQIVTFSQRQLLGVAPTTGEILWRRPFVSRNQTNSFTPLLHGQTLIVSGQEMGITGFTVAKRNGQWTTEDVWTNTDVSIYMSTAVIAHDALFALSHRRQGQFFALDATTGRVLWTTAGRDAQNAALVRAGDILFALKEDGELIVARASRSAFEPLRRYTVAMSETWAQPVVSGHRIFIKDVSTVALWTLD
jgi:outer membrane protein assembly factor BamB